MRKHFSEHIERKAKEHSDFVFVTGDLGYNALEGVIGVMGDRFINGGVAEQNIVGMAAGMASTGMQVICYSIAPFIVYRCLEQVRNDVCFHKQPVYMVGNGGGYGYGIMGSSHHAIEDIAVLSPLPNMMCYIPAFIDDMHHCIDAMFARRGPAYLRLGLGKNMPDGYGLTDFGLAAKANPEARLTVLALGPVANNVFAALKEHPHRDKVEVFVINRMPMPVLPHEVSASIGRSGNILVIEEHVAIGGLASAVSLLTHENNLLVNRFQSLRAAGYPDGTYGSQAYHQQQSGLDEQNIAAVIHHYF